MKNLTNEYGGLYYNALKLKYQSLEAEAKANLSIYFDKSVGIGEHSDILLEFDKWITILTDAQDKLATLERNFVYIEKV